MIQPDSHSMQRSFSPGSEWVYFKIYSGPKTGDRLLCHLVNPLVMKLFEDKLIDRWFFIRYVDPDYHLRLRLHLPDKCNFQITVDLFKDFSKSYLQNGLIHKIQLDTYHPEIERYGPSTLGYSEMIFFYDSEMCIQLLDVLSGDRNEEERWLVGLQAINALLDDFKYQDTQKVELLRNMNLSFGKEFHKDSNLAKQISKKYREHKGKIEARIYGAEDNVMSKYVRNIIKIRSARIETITSKILLYIEKDKTLVLDDLLSNYIHMMMNRLFRARQRTMEMVLYDFLFRTYKSKVAKNKYQ